MSKIAEKAAIPDKKEVCQNMNTKKMRPLLCLALAMLVLFLPACTKEKEENSPDDVLLPISINGKEIKVGETTVQTLLDEGLDVSWVDENYERITVDPPRSWRLTLTTPVAVLKLRTTCPSRSPW